MEANRSTYECSRCGAKNVDEADNDCRPFDGLSEDVCPSMPVRTASGMATGALRLRAPGE